MAEGTLHSISESELHSDLSLVLDNVQRGQSYIITRDGASIARLVPFEQPNFTSRAEVVQAFAALLNWWGFERRGGVHCGL
ncbi:prevent-host-death family protein [Micromonospora globispora]|uniref:type II toxin-antitoxin system Phd/YefM family antitoxin n=1 Tax=Micromonospora globispora TaxID=1450148 RepID=UPI000D6F1915|nr:type II toxin-antitoxin system prevent-host-death family antitoxin [Micromonospora globispora]PWU60698.1 prevent-host-death family protein [Micromonospora globispora]RQW86693.1 prevent-host-death family protein [Micromonospora globispora]